MRRCRCLWILLAVLLLSSCGGEAVSPTPTPVPAPISTPEPTPAETPTWYGDAIFSDEPDSLLMDPTEAPPGTVHYGALLSHGLADPDNSGKRFWVKIDNEESALLTLAEMKTMKGRELLLSAPPREGNYSEKVSDSLTAVLEWETEPVQVCVFTIQTELCYAERNGKGYQYETCGYTPAPVRDVEQVRQVLEDLVQRHSLQGETYVYPYAEPNIGAVWTQLTKAQILALAEDEDVGRIVYAVDYWP